HVADHVAHEPAEYTAPEQPGKGYTEAARLEAEPCARKSESRDAQHAYRRERTHPQRRHFGRTTRLPGFGLFACSLPRPHRPHALPPSVRSHAPQQAFDSSRTRRM